MNLYLPLNYLNSIINRSNYKIIFNVKAQICGKDFYAIHTQKII